MVMGGLLADTVSNRGQAARGRLTARGLLESVQPLPPKTRLQQRGIGICA